MEDNKDNKSKSNRIHKKDIQKIIEFIESVQYGSVVVIIQDGHIVQIEKNEKLRISKVD